MKGPVKVVLTVVAVSALVSGSFWGGMAYQSAKGPAGMPAGAGQGLRGPGADLTEEEQAELEGMTDEERQAFMQEKFGTNGPTGGGPMRGGTLDGEVIEVADDTMTLSLDTGSQTVYTDADTLVAYVEGAATLGAGSQVMVIAQPAADGVTTATVVVVKQ